MPRASATGGLSLHRAAEFEVTTDCSQLGKLGADSPATSCRPLPGSLETTTICGNFADLVSQRRRGKPASCVQALRAPLVTASGAARISPPSRRPRPPLSDTSQEVPRIVILLLQLGICSKRIIIRTVSSTLPSHGCQTRKGWWSLGQASPGTSQEALRILFLSHHHRWW